MVCPYCKITYADFRTGLTYQMVYDMIKTRKWKRRHGVLGYWHQLKQSMFEQHKKECENEKNDFDCPMPNIDEY
jgi:hypothetical protein